MRADGHPATLHASRLIDLPTYQRIREIAPELHVNEDLPDSEQPLWYRLSRITSAAIAVATIDKVFDGDWDEATIASHASALSFTNGDRLGPDQVRWFFGPVGYVLRDVRALETPVYCRGWQGFWTLPDDAERAVVEQIGSRP